MRLPACVHDPASGRLTTPMNAYGAPMFRLLRYFSVASLLSIAVAAVLLGALYRHAALGNLSSMGEQKNVALAHALSNAMRAETEALLAPDDDDADPSLREARLASLSRSVLRYTRELSVVKVKFYGRDGITVFSSDPAQIGDDKYLFSVFTMALKLIRFYYKMRW
jgi:hypothetical protein